MKKTISIEILVKDKNNMGNTIYKAQVESMGDLLSLTYQFDNKTKYRKSTDKNWYYAKTMMKRLFKKEMSNTINIELVETNSFNESPKVNRRAEKVMDSKKRRGSSSRATSSLEKRQTRENFQVELTNQLYKLYIKDYYIGMHNLNTYVGDFDNCLDEINHIESKLSPNIVDDTYSKAMQEIVQKKVTIQQPYF
ncbi:hypothetical protein [Priestia megaterium]|uniref:hypothetical protein n=1 Tax=Priestia megaterium TaxID=1404 RepID=UPI0034580BDE